VGAARQWLNEMANTVMKELNEYWNASL